jgi:alpha-beta hydrolase superfamily lysophospholipase
MANRQPETSTLVLPDGTRLRVLRWASSKPAKGVMLIQHGIGEHAGRYQTYADELAEMPLDLWSFDSRGHGHSDGPRGHAAKGFATLVEDLVVVINHVKEKTGTTRMVLAGHSLGAAIVATYASTRTPDPAIHALVLSAPPTRIPLTAAQSVKVGIGKVLASVLPGLTMPTGLPPTGISSDPSEVKRYVDDPLVHDKVSAALGVSLTRDAEKLLETAHRILLPVLAFQGDADTVVPISETRKFIPLLGSKDVTWKELPGSFHETHHETAARRAAMFDTLRGWLAPRLSG